MARNPTWTATACLEEQDWASHIRVVCIVTGYWIFLWTGRLETFDPIHSALATLCGLFTAKIRWSESQVAIAKGVCPLCDRYFWFGSQVQRNFQLLLSGLCKLYKLSRSNITHPGSRWEFTSAISKGSYCLWVCISFITKNISTVILKLFSATVRLDRGRNS